MRPRDLGGDDWREWWEVRTAGRAAELEEQREQYIQGAHVAWQLGAGPGKRFGQYLRDIGLTDTQRRSGARLSAGDKLADAARIAAADKRGRAHGESPIRASRRDRGKGRTRR